MTRTTRTVFVNTLLVIGALLVAFPLLWMISVSFMPTGAASTYPPPLFPAEPTLDNYRELFSKHAAGRYMLNSALIATIATLISLDRKSTRLNSSHVVTSRMPSSA